MKQTGARYIRRRKQELVDKEPVNISHYNSEEPWVRVSNTVIKRPRILKRQAD